MYVLLFLRGNTVLCNYEVDKFIKMVNETKQLHVVGWKNGEGYFCHQLNNLSSPISYQV